MPWMETCLVEERHRFMIALESGLFAMSELCERFGISRKTAYKWVGRYRCSGLEGLKNRSRRPLSSPARTPRDVVRLVVEARRRFPRWGPRKLLGLIAGHQPDLTLPAESTVAAILKREGLIEGRRRRRRRAHPGAPPRRPSTEPNEVWTADYKGQFRTRDGCYCYPLTILDDYSRYLVAVDALPSTGLAGARAVFDRVFRTYGLPRAIRTDNGTPFVGNGIYGMSQLNVWWIQLGIVHQRIQPGKPQQNGRHERMHRTLAEATTRPPGLHARDQQRRFDAFRTEYNEIRPHEACNDAPPASVWSSPTRPYPPRIPTPDYPGHFLPRLVAANGTFKFKNHTLFLSQPLHGQYIALEEIDESIWSVYFYSLLLGRLDERTWRIAS